MIPITPAKSSPGQCSSAVGRPKLAAMSKPCRVATLLGFGVFLLVFQAGAWRCSANVYATNVKIQGGFTNITAHAGTNILLSYVLNEPASAGVSIQIHSTSNIVKTISISAPNAGTQRGTNEIAWDGTDDTGATLPQNTYFVSITARSHGYATWTQITDDTNSGNAIFQGRGIAVDQNTNSPYYGRVFVANSQAAIPAPPDTLGYQLGILKCNADGSYADEGGVSDGGYPWAGDLFSPFHLEVWTNDLVYVNDLRTNGTIVAFDPVISTNFLEVLRPDNWPNSNVGLSGPAFSMAGTNTFLWMADSTITLASQPPGVGVLRYALKSSGVCASNDTGVVAIAMGADLNENPTDIATDGAGNIYVVCGGAEPGDTNNRVLCFPPFPSSLSTNNPLTNAAWAIGANDDTMAGGSGIAVDPTGTYVAVAFAGLSIGTNGCTQIFYASNGVLVTNLDLGIELSGNATHEDRDCAWDAVGNVYYIDNYQAVWRAVSPPGSNQSTTLAMPSIKLLPPITPPAPAGPITITRITVSGGEVTIDFKAGSNDVASAFSIVAAPIPGGPYATLSTATVTQTGQGTFHVQFPLGPVTQYFRIVAQGTSTSGNQPQFSQITKTGSSIVLSFLAGTGDSASQFTLLSAATVSGSYSPQSAVITQLSPGHFQASVSAVGSNAFYRIQKH